jgi:vitamin B12/bleomycin/antimicrobial peptide transport system ATP-binding/permease protein
MGKTLLVRSVAGLWPWGRGMIERPAEGGVMIVPQKTYLPLGSLRATLQYPSVDAMVPKETLEGALTDCGLGHLVPRLERVERWEQVLSNGERQCLAFARILVHRPQVIVFDDAWSALDEATQRTLLAALKRSLPASTVLSLGQRPAVSGFHERTLEITRSDAGAVLAQTKSVPSCEGTST